MLIALKYVLVAVCVLLIIAILIQNKGVGLSAMFGGEGGVYRTKRGAEKVVAVATVVLVALFGILSFIIPLWDRIMMFFAS